MENFVDKKLEASLEDGQHSFMLSNAELAEAIDYARSNSYGSSSEVAALFKRHLEHLLFLQSHRAEMVVSTPPPVL